LRSVKQSAINGNNIARLYLATRVNLGHTVNDNTTGKDKFVCFPA